MWSLGQSIYSVIFGRTGTESAAAFNITQTIEALAFTFFSGLACACNVLVGHLIGAKKNEEAYLFAQKTIRICVLSGVIIGSFLFFLAPIIFSGYGNLTYEIKKISVNILRIMGIVLWIKVTNMLIIQGVLRSGGDVTYTLIQNMSSMWLISIPLTFMVAQTSKASIYLVPICSFSEEVIKLIASYKRFLSKKWLKNLTD